MLNIAGPEFDYAQVVYTVLQECEHRRRGFDTARFDKEVQAAAQEKLAQIKAAYEELGGSDAYWESLQKEVVQTVLPQYVAPAREITRIERRSAGLGVRIFYALIGLVLGVIIIEVPFIPIVENLFAVGTTVAGFLWPDIRRFYHERIHSKLLNRLVRDSARYQENARLTYVTRQQLNESFEPGGKRRVTS